VRKIPDTIPAEVIGHLLAADALTLAPDVETKGLFHGPLDRTGFHIWVLAA